MLGGEGATCLFSLSPWTSSCRLTGHSGLMHPECVQSLMQHLRLSSSFHECLCVLGKNELQDVEPARASSGWHGVEPRNRGRC